MVSYITWLRLFIINNFILYAGRFFPKLIIFLILSSFSYSQSISIDNTGAEVWGTSQVIKGRLDGFSSTEGILYLNNKPIKFSTEQSGSTFKIPVKLSDGINNIYIKIGSFQSDTLILRLGYKLLPSTFAYSEVSGDTIFLRGRLLDNPKNLTISFKWSQDENNPSPVIIKNDSDTSASLLFRKNNPEGEYYFNLYAITSESDTVKVRTYFTNTENGVKPFNIKNDHASWIHSAVLYEITPAFFVSGGKFNDITNKLTELVRLGVNTIWIQPIYATRGRGQGYAIMDYFKVRSDLGTESELQNLISTARSMGLRVLFDFVPNHTSIHHPYAKHSIEFGKNSHYWDYYQRDYDLAPYSTHYKPYKGFINYFWDELPNLNFNNPEVKKWITEAILYWVKKFDIDGYRFDAVWGVTARNPQFTKDLRIALKSIKPELLLLAEDKATRPEVFDERFDAAFDWMPEEQWVSHWSWQPGTDYIPNLNLTIFNYPAEHERPALLKKAIDNPPVGFPPDAKVLHFMDNNDVWYFLTHHSIEQTRMTAALLFTLPGLPLIYNGDEIGMTGHPYWGQPVFERNKPNDHIDQYNLFPYYQKLIRLRKELPALQSNNYSEIDVEPSEYIFGFKRWSSDQNIFTFLNMSASPKVVSFGIPIDKINKDTSKIYYLTDVINGTVLSGTSARLQNSSIDMEGYSTKVFLLSDSVYSLPWTEIYLTKSVPPGLELRTNSPNPFSSTISLKFTQPENGFADLRIYDFFGREAAVLCSEEKSSGEHQIIFDASNLPDGIYNCRFSYNGYILKTNLYKSRY